MACTGRTLGSTRRRHPHRRSRHLGLHPLRSANPHSEIRAKIVRRGQSNIIHQAEAMLPRDLYTYILVLIA
jgi:hypothetical protein